jgi:hypothetical protein
MGVFSGGEERVGEYEGCESYLWVGSVGAGMAGGGPAAEVVARMATLFRREVGQWGLVKGLGRVRVMRRSSPRSRIGGEMAGGKGSMHGRSFEQE